VVGRTPSDTHVEHMATTSDARVGTTLAGYRIERLLGRGGMSVVYLAEDPRLGRRVALKVIAPDLAADERFRERFLRESRIAASLDHSNVIPIYEAGEADGLLYIAMRYVEGTELKSVLASTGPLSVAMSLDIVGQAASALDLAHARGLVHRDVKPANILLADEDERGRGLHVYLSDFGLTKQASSESGLTETGQFVGTAEYIAPEQIEHGDVGASSDVYALSCVLFECLTGEPPFRRDSLMAMLWAHVHDPPPAASERRAGLPSVIDSVLARGMAKSPRDRYPTCGALVTAARGALSLGAAQQRRGRLEQLARKPAVALAGLAAVAAAVAAVVGLVILRGDEAGAGPTTVLAVDSLQRIDPATDRLAATVPLGSVVWRVAAGEGSVWVIDRDSRYRRVSAATNEAVGTGTTAGLASGIAVGFGSVWIANYEGSTATSGTITEVDPATGRARRVIPVAVEQRVPSRPTFNDVVADPFSRSVWVVSPLELALKRIRPNLGTLAATVPTGETTPWQLAAGEGAVWATTNFGTVRVDPSRNAVVARVALPFDPRDIAVGAGAVWIANGTGNSIWVVDPDTNRVVDRIPVGLEPMGVAVGEGAVWVANRRDGTVSRIDPQRGAVTATIHVGGHPEDVAVGPGGVWVAVHRPFAGADGKLSEPEYASAVGWITDETSGLAFSAFEPLYRLLRARDPVAPDARISTPPQLGHEVVAINEAQLAYLSALEPPTAFAADHDRYVSGLRELGRLHAQLARELELAKFPQVYDTMNAINTSALRLRSELSPRFRELVPRHPLACCSAY
jgi:serine/threonine-protein kinase